MQRILVVDDEIKICAFLEKFFQGRGFEVETTTSPVEALERIKVRRPDLVLLDVRMSPMSGLEVLRVARSLVPDLRVVMVSAIDDEQVVQEALSLGAVDYVTKPFMLDGRWWAERFFWSSPGTQPPSHGPHAPAA